MSDDSSSRMEFWRFSREERAVSYLYIPEDATFEQAMGWLRSQLFPYQGPVHHSICEFHLSDKTLIKWKTGTHFNDFGG